MRLAVLADIHGNSFALAAVLEHAARQGADLFVNLGDIHYGPLDPAGTADLLAGQPMVTIAGNQDRLLLTPPPEPGPTLAYVLAALSAWELTRLAALPWAMTLEAGVLLCHGTPCDDTRYLLDDVTSGRPVLRPAGDVEADLMGWNYPLVLCAHSHIPRVLDTGRRLVVNPGSVGLPAYADDQPPHAMSCGSPHARYAVLERTGAGWRAELFEVVYDWQAAAALAEANGRADWARCLATGVAEPPARDAAPAARPAGPGARQGAS
jgi:predicted phosphodiesterase